MSSSEIQEYAARFRVSITSQVRASGAAQTG